VETSAKNLPWESLAVNEDNAILIEKALKK